jgi:hypothetical protein
MGSGPFLHIGRLPVTPYCRRPCSFRVKVYAVAEINAGRINFQSARTRISLSDRYRLNFARDQRPYEMKAAWKVEFLEVGYSRNNPPIPKTSKLGGQWYAVRRITAAL